VNLETDPRVRAAYAEGAGIYRIIPDAVAIPRSTPEVAEVITWARQSRRPLVPRGAGSGMPGSNVGRGVILDLSQGFGHLEIDPQRRWARTGASVTWQTLTDAARLHGLRLPPDPSSGAFATCGGMVAANASGPRTVRYGSVRPWVQALEVVGVEGDVRWIRRGAGNGGREALQLSDADRRTIADRFPKTRKNSSGYALDAYAASGDEIDLLVGSEGTLAVVTQVEWRLDAIPAEAGGVTVACADLALLDTIVPFLLSLEPSAVELMDGTLLGFMGDGAVPRGTACLLLVEFERDQAAGAQAVASEAARGLGHEPGVLEVRQAAGRRDLEALWEVRRRGSSSLARLPETRRSLQVVEDGCVPLHRLSHYLAGLRAAAAARELPIALFGHAGDGHVHVNVLPDVTRTGWRKAVQGFHDDVVGLLLRLGGTPSGEHGDGRLRAGVLERFFGADVMALFARVKRAYDPLTILNPGVILPAADWAPLADLKVGPDAAPIPDDIAARLRAVERSGGWATPKPELAR